MTDRAVPLDDLPNINPDALHPIDIPALAGKCTLSHPLRILLLYGSLRERSFSRFAAEEAGRLLRWFGAETCTFNPRGLPFPDAEGPDHPKVRELRELASKPPVKLSITHILLPSFRQAQDRV